MLTVAKTSKKKSDLLESFGVVAAATVALWLLATAFVRPSWAVRLDIGDGSGTVGDTVIVGITTTNLTGLNVYSYELKVTWTSTRASVVGAPEEGTLTSPWGAVTFNAGSGQVKVVAAGETPLAGSGTLINLKFALGPSSGSTTLTFADFIFNEGAPNDTITNGSLNVAARPTITITPNSGQVLVGDSLLFSTTGGTAPYTYTSSDPTVADFRGNAYLKGVSPGSVYATARDQNGITDVTDGPIYVRAIRLTAGTAAGRPGDTVVVPMTITDPTAFDIKSAEFSVTYNEAQLTALGTIDGGTVAEAAGWLASAAGVTSGQIKVSMAGAAGLASAGTLVYLEFLIDPVASSTSSTLTVTGGLFSETYAPIQVNGSVAITAFPTLTVSPNIATIVAGDNLQFTVAGGATLPLTWGVTDTARASIDGSGKLTALQAGTTRVFVIDHAGGTDTTGVISICHLRVIAPADTIPYNFPRPVPISPDRSLTGLGIYGWELVLTYDAAKVAVTGVTTDGTASSSWGMPVTNNATAGKLVMAHAGMAPLSGNLPLVIVSFKGLLPGVKTTSSLAITKVLFNEGNPCALFSNGSLYVTGIADGQAPRLHLEQNAPNPFFDSTTIPFALDDHGDVRLDVYSAGGAVVKTLETGSREAGVWYFAVWDGTNDGGERVASGVYFCRLKAGGVQLTRKMVLLR